jgi:hypothetical protein
VAASGWVFPPMSYRVATIPSVSHQFDLLQLDSPAPPPLPLGDGRTRSTPSESQGAVSDEVREQMGVLVNIIIDVFLEHRKVTREAKQERTPELQ